MHKKVKKGLNKKSMKNPICSRYNCSDRKNLKKCKFCEDIFCEEHLKPFIPEIGLSKNMERHRGNDGHPCFAYLKHESKEDEKRKKRELDGLNSLLGKGRLVKIKNMNNSINSHFKIKEHFSKKNVKNRKDFKEFENVNTNSKMDKNKRIFNKIVDQSISIIKWGVICTIGVLISGFIIDKLFITNILLANLFTAFLILIVVEMVKSHDSRYSFRMNWFIFYFLIYSNIIWITKEFVFSGMYFRYEFLPFLAVGFILAISIITLSSMRLKSSSLPWAYIVLILILVVGNIGSINSFIPQNMNPSINISELSEQKRICPTTTYGPEIPFILNVNKFDSISGIQSITSAMIDQTVWSIENGVRSCYMGKYKNQFPDWIYCDDLIVSRWETRNSGVINYRWYTAVSSTWKPATAGSSDSYIFNGFECENGQKVTVEKGVTNYYVYDSRDGKQIKIKY